MNKTSLIMAPRGNLRVVGLGALGEMEVARLQEFGFYNGAPLTKLSHGVNGITVNSFGAKVAITRALASNIVVEEADGDS